MKTPILAGALITLLAAGCATSQKTAELPPMNSPGSKFSILPSVVQRTVIAMDGAAEIHDINKVGQDVYEVQFANSVANPNLYIGLDGTLVKTNNIMIGPTPTGRTTSGTQIPLPVQKTLQILLPNADIAHIQPQTHTLYEITFTDSDSHPPMLINDDGTVLNERKTQ